MEFSHTPIPPRIDHLEHSTPKRCLQRHLFRASLLRALPNLIRLPGLADDLPQRHEDAEREHQHHPTHRDDEHRLDR
jgi:hypothetical protein